MKQVEPRAEPVADHELGGLFGGLECFRRAVLAVSGGADSMALLHLVARWHKANASAVRPALEVVTVDHGLRSESAEEAHWVGLSAQKLGFKHTTLTWSGYKPAGGLQAAAREARYRLMEEHAAASGEGPAAVVTAHTEDDQAETLLMRLARGSGLDGLASMPSRRSLTRDGGVAIVRPLLTVARGRLVAFLVANGLEWREDPSNDCLDFERVRLRAARVALAELGLTNDKIALSAGRLMRARVALDRAAEDFCNTHIDIHDGVYAELDRETLQGAAAELRIRVLAHVLGAFGGAAKPARLVKIEALDAALGAGRRSAQTLGGCMISAGVKRVRVFREPGLHALHEVELDPGRKVFWDNRFQVWTAGAGALADAGIPGPFTVRALGMATYATLRAGFARNERPPARAAASLPAFWSGDRLLAVPLLMPYLRDGALAGPYGHGLCTGPEAGLFSAVFDSWYRANHETWQNGPSLLS